MYTAHTIVLPTGYIRGKGLYYKRKLIWCTVDRKFNRVKIPAHIKYYNHASMKLYKVNQSLKCDNMYIILYYHYTDYGPKLKGERERER